MVPRRIIPLLVVVSAVCLGAPVVAHAQSTPPNPIAQENALPGDVLWQGVDAAPADLEAYAKTTSVAPGGGLPLAVKATAAYRVEIHRLGWYGGDGGRRVACLPADCTTSRPAVTQTPAGTPDASTGLLAAGWTTTDTWTVPAGAVTGEYLAEIVLTAGSASSKSVRVPFVVRAPTGSAPAPILKMAETSTQVAYNNWGGRSSYGYNSTPTTAVKLSYDRPQAPDARLHTTGPSYTNHAMVRWLERQGYAINYVSDIDVAKAPAMLLQHRNVLIEGHQEYWDSATRDGLDAAVAQGTNVTFVGANIGYWQIRYEDDYRTFAIYKYEPDPWPVSRERTTLFRSLGRAECKLIGVQYGGHDTTNYTQRPYTLDAASLGDPWLAGTGFAAGDTVPGIVGYEWDNIVPGCSAGTATRFFTYDGTARSEPGADLVRSVAPSGARIFAAGTLQLPWALDAYPTRPAGVAVDPRMQRFVANAIEDLGRPAAPSAVSATHQGGAVDLAWTLPANDPRIADVRILRHDGPDAFTAESSAVTEVCTVAVSAGSTCVDSTAPAKGTFRYLAIARDQWGTSSGTLSPVVDRGIVTLTLASTPAGASVTVNGVARTAPWSGDFNTGTTVAISAPASFDADGRRYGFASWSDGGPRERSAYLVPADDTTLTATYTDLGPLAPVAAYGFDDGSGGVARDSSGGEHDGVLRGGTWVTDGRHGGALKFDGIDDWVTVADDNALDLTGKLTLSAWVRPQALGRYDNVLIKEAPGSLAYALYATSGDGRKPSAFAGDAGVFAPSGIDAGGWINLALTSDGSEVALWVNGVAVNRAPVVTPIPTTDDPLRIGGTSVWADEFFDGTIDDVRVYARALTASEIAADMNTGVPAPPPSTAAPKPVAQYGFDEGRGTVARDSSGNGLDGELSGGVAWTSAGYHGKALRFDGINDLVTIADANQIDLTSTGTVSAWVQLDPAASGYNTVVLKEDVGRSSYSLYATDSAGRQPNASFGDVATYSPQTIARDTWVNLAMVADGASVKIYLDGRLESSQPAPTTTPSGGVLRIGGNAVWSGENFRGVIDDVRVYDRALSEAQLAADRDAAVPEAGPLPVAQWSFDQVGAGNVTPDSSGNGLDGTVSGATPVSDGRIGGALSFDGVNDWVTVAAAPELDFSGPMTMAAWVKPDVVGNYDTVLIREKGSSAAYSMYTTNGGNQKRPNAALDETTSYAQQQIQPGVWTHLTATFDGTRLRLWINGLMVDSVAAAAAPSSTGVLRIGGNAVWSGEFFSGLIDDVQLYKVALSGEQIAKLIDVPAVPPGPAATAAAGERPATTDQTVAPSDPNATPPSTTSSTTTRSSSSLRRPSSKTQRSLRPRIKIRRARSRVARGRTVVLRGVLSGDFARTGDKVVMLEVLKGRTWRSVRTVRVDARGRFTVRQRLSKKARLGLVRYRVRTLPPRGSGIQVARTGRDAARIRRHPAVTVSPVVSGATARRRWRHPRYPARPLEVRSSERCRSG